ncbi:MAG: acetyltransferase [Muribaculaceae bacterium]|nr:acetyltransferase [Muribaculaceae bacterium]
MKNIAIYGSGGFGKEVACLIDRINRAAETPRWKLIGFFDDGKPAGTAVSHYGNVLGGINQLNSWPTPLDVTIAMGSPSVIKMIAEKITNEQVSFPNVIDPSFTLADKDTFTIGCGNLIQRDCFASCDTVIGNFNVLNGSVVIGHDARLGNYNVIMPNVRISGDVTIGELNLLGVSSTIIQRVKIGKGVRLSPGSVLLSKPKDDGLYIGNPAKRFKY